MSKPSKNSSFRGNVLPIAMIGAALLLQAGAALAESDGEAIYRFYCYQCHGYAGDAQTLASTSLSPPPRDFTSVSADEFPIERIVETVLEGREGTGMVSFRDVLNERDADDIQAYVLDAANSQWEEAQLPGWWRGFKAWVLDLVAVVFAFFLG